MVRRIDEPEPWAQALGCIEWFSNWDSLESQLSAAGMHIETLDVQVTTDDNEVEDFTYGKESQ